MSGGQSASGDGVVRLIQAQIDPANYKTAPPNQFNEAWFPQDISYETLVQVVGDEQLTGEMVGKGGIGGLIWLVKRGVNSMWRYGFIAKNTVSAYGGNSTWATVVNTMLGSSGGASGPHPSLTYASELGIPYESTQQSQIDVNPDLSVNYSKVRQFTGVVKISCDTTKVGDLLMNGVISAAAIADTRDIGQTTRGAFVPADMGMKAVTSKDWVNRINIDGNGVVLVMGCDVPDKWACPDADITEYHRGEVWRGEIPTNPATTTGNEEFGCLTEGWVTSTGTSLAGVYSNLQMPQVDEAAHVRFNLKFPVKCQLGGGTDNQSYVIRVQALHVFSSAANNGVVTYKATNEVKMATIVTSDGTTATAPGTGFGEVEFHVDRPHGDIHFIASGKWIGTYFAVLYDLVNPHSATSGFPLLSLTDSIQIKVTALTIDESGWIGPVRVAKWEGLSAGQTVNIKGRGIAQCVPEGNAAQFVKDSVMKSDDAFNLEVLPLMSLLYNAAGVPLKRVYALNDYERLVNGLQDLSAETVGMWAAHAGARTVGTAAAAGLFGDVLGALGGAAGGLLGGIIPGGAAIGSHIGASIGSHLGGLADMATGQSAGAFGAGSAAGAFGHGSAAGLFGSRRRARDH
jgi:hypothetical protein